MADLKTKPTQVSVKKFLNAILDEGVRTDCKTIAALMEKATKAKPKMWGDTIIGFGVRTQRYSDGSERDWMRLSFSPRKQNITLYLPVFAGRKEIEAKLGKFVSTKACLHIKKLSDVHMPTLIKLLKESAKQDDCGCRS